MNEASTYRIGFDVAKGVFQVHGVSNAAGEPVVLRRRLQRGAVEGFFAELPRSLIGMEACGSAHYWARLAKSSGRELRPRGQADAAGVCESLCQAQQDRCA